MKRIIGISPTTTFMFTQYPKTRNNDDCVKTIYNSQFYEADDEREDDDNALALGCALIAGLIVMI